MGLIPKCQKCGALLDISGKCIKDPNHKNVIYIPKSEDEIKKDKSNNEVKIGFYLIEKYELHEALMHFENAINLHKNNFKAWLGKGKVYFMQNKFDKALINIDKALTIDPNSIRALQLKKNIYEVDNNKEEVKKIKREIELEKAKKAADQEDIKLKANLTAIIYYTKNLDDFRKKEGDDKCYNWERFKEYCTPNNTKSLSNWLYLNWEGESVKVQLKKFGINANTSHSVNKEKLICLDIMDRDLFNSVWDYYKNEINEGYGSMEKFVEGYDTMEYIGKDTKISKRLFAYFCKPRNIEIDKKFIEKLESDVKKKGNVILKLDEILKSIDYSGLGIYNLINSINYYFQHRSIELKAFKYEFGSDLILFESIKEQPIGDIL